MAKKKGEGINWDPEKVRRFRMAYDARVKDGVSPRSVADDDAFEFEGDTFNMAFAHYMLEYLETCVFWIPQSRVYAQQPELE